LTQTRLVFVFLFCSFGQVGGRDVTKIIGLNAMDAGLPLGRAGWPVLMPPGLSSSLRNVSQATVTNKVMGMARPSADGAKEAHRLKTHEARLGTPTTPFPFTAKRIKVRAGLIPGRRRTFNKIKVLGKGLRLWRAA
jgi:hypothetical protein